MGNQDLEALQKGPEGEKAAQEKLDRMMPPKGEKVDDKGEFGFDKAKLKKAMDKFKREYPTEVNQSEISDVKFVEGTYDNKTKFTIFDRFKDEFENGRAGHAQTLGPLKGDDGYHYYGVVDFNRGDDYEARTVVFRSKAKSEVYKEPEKESDEQKAINKAKEFFNKKLFERIPEDSPEADDIIDQVSENLAGPSPREAYTGDRKYYVYKVDKDTKLVFRKK